MSPSNVCTNGSQDHHNRMRVGTCTYTAYVLCRGPAASHSKGLQFTSCWLCDVHVRVECSARKYVESRFISRELTILTPAFVEAAAWTRSSESSRLSIHCEFYDASAKEG